MPLYEYQCEACGHRFEVIQKYSDTPLEVCPKCNGVVRKLLSSPAIQFKGSGWYITDYARAGKPEGGAPGKPDAAGKTDASGSKPSTETKTESKTESKTETKSESKADSKPSTS